MESNVMQGKNCKGRTPMQTFLDGIELCNKYVYDQEEVKSVA